MGIAERPTLSATSSTRSEDALAFAEAFVLAHARTERQRQILQVALAGLRAQALDVEMPQFVHLPLSVHAAIPGDEAPAIPLAAATSLLFLGLDILDDLADGDLPEHWHCYQAAEINLAAVTLLCALPPLLLAELDVPPAGRSAIQQVLAEGLLRMIAGQHDDLAHAGTVNPSVEAVEASVAAKSGEEVATFAAMAALLAGAGQEQVERYAEIGRCIGTGGQLTDDCNDLFHQAWSRDLANGTRTLPIALHLEREEGAERARFLRLLEEARTDAGAQERVRQELRAAGELRRCAVIVEVYRQRGLRLLDEAGSLEPGRSGLRTLLGLLSFFGEGVASQEVL